MTKFHLDKLNDKIELGSIVAWPTKGYGKRIIVIGKVIRMTNKGFKIMPWDVGTGAWLDQNYAIEQVREPDACLVIDDFFCSKFGECYRG